MNVMVIVKAKTLILTKWLNNKLPNYVDYLI